MKEATESRAALWLADKLRQRLKERWVEPGRFLPGERVLAREYGVSSATVGKAVKILERDHLIAAENRRGRRVLHSGGAINTSHPVAFVFAASMDDYSRVGGYFRAMLVELQRAAGLQQKALLNISSSGRSVEEIVAHLKAASAAGVIVDSGDARLLDGIRKSGLPAIAADSWGEGVPLDAVLQDGFQGGVLAASFLTGKGHRRIGWMGLRVGNQGGVQTLERLGGALAGLSRAGLEVPSRYRAEVSEGDEEKVFDAAARTLLSQPERPTAVLALWQGATKAVTRVAIEMGLVLGKDLELVGWSTEEEYDSDYAPAFGLAAVQPAVVWSVRTMAEMCMTRLAQRQSDPALPITQTRIPTRLKMP